MTKNSAIERNPVRPTTKSVETRARIIRGALDALETHGIGEVTTRKIAANAKVRLATLHYHFDSKETLLLAVLEDLNASMLARYQEELRNSDDFETHVAELIRSIWRYVERTPEQQFVQLELTLYALRTKGSEWLAAKQYDAYIDVYKRLIVEGQGSQDPALERIGLALSRFILGGIDGLILQSFALRNAADTQAGLEALIVATRDYLRHLLDS